jgi:hypothetical protein
MLARPATFASPLGDDERPLQRPSYGRYLCAPNFVKSVISAREIFYPMSRKKLGYWAVNASIIAGVVVMETQYGLLSDATNLQSLGFMASVYLFEPVYQSVNMILAPYPKVAVAEPTLPADAVVIDIHEDQDEEVLSAREQAAEEEREIRIPLRSLAQERRREQRSGFIREPEFSVEMSAMLGKMKHLMNEVREVAVVAKNSKPVMLKMPFANVLSREELTARKKHHHVIDVHASEFYIPADDSLEAKYHDSAAVNFNVLSKEELTTRKKHHHVIDVHASRFDISAEDSLEVKYHDGAPINFLARESHHVIDIPADPLDLLESDKLKADNDSAEYKAPCGDPDALEIAIPIESELETVNLDALLSQEKSGYFEDVTHDRLEEANEPSSHPLPANPAPPLFIERRRDMSDVGVMIACHNSASVIAETIQSCLRHVKPEQIFVIDNGNSLQPADNTREIVKAIHPDINYVWSHYGNKTVAQYVATLISPYTYLLTIDDDVHLPRVLNLATHRIQDRVKAVCYPVRAIHPDRESSLLIELQDLEYQQSDLAKSIESKYAGGVSFPHGAVCLWDRDTFQKVLLLHDTIFYAEDVKLGLILQMLGFKMELEASCWFDTEAPTTYFGEAPNLYEQRVRSWEMGRQVIFFKFLSQLFTVWRPDWKDNFFYKVSQFYDVYSNLADWWRLPLLIIMGANPNFWARVAEFYAFNMIPALVWNYVKLPYCERTDLQIPLRTCVALPFYKAMSSAMAFGGAIRAVSIYLPNFQPKPTINEIIKLELGEEAKLKQEIDDEPINGPLTFKHILYERRHQFFPIVREPPSVAEVSQGVSSERTSRRLSFFSAVHESKAAVNDGDSPRPKVDEVSLPRASPFSSSVK